MHRKEFQTLLTRTLETCLQINATKGTEYTRGSVDAGSNFYRLGMALNQPPEVILWVYVQKHLDSILNYITNIQEYGTKQKLSEPIEGRIHDVIMYMCLLLGLIIDRERNEDAANLDFNPQNRMETVTWTLNDRGGSSPSV